MKYFYLLFIVLLVNSENSFAAATYEIEATVTHYYKDPSTGENTDKIIAENRRSVREPDWEPLLILGGNTWKLRLIVYSTSHEIDQEKKASVSAILRTPGEMPKYSSELTSTNMIVDAPLDQEIKQVWFFGGYDTYVLKFRVYSGAHEKN